MSDSEYIYRERAEENRLTRIESKVDGINTRLDISNGRLAKLEGDVRKLEAEHVASSAKSRLVVMLLTIGAATGGFIATVTFGVLSALG